MDIDDHKNINHDNKFHLLFEDTVENVILAAVKFSVEHTVEHISDRLQTVTVEWRIMNKVETM